MHPHRERSHSQSLLVEHVRVLHVVLGSWMSPGASNARAISPETRWAVRYVLAWAVCTVALALPVFIALGFPSRAR